MLKEYLSYFVEMKNAWKYIVIMLINREKMQFMYYNTFFSISEFYLCYFRNFPRNKAVFRLLNMSVYSQVL